MAPALPQCGPPCRASGSKLGAAGESGCYHGRVARSRVRIWLVIFFVPILLVLGGIGYLAWRQSVAAVRVEFSPVPRFIGARTPITLDLHARRGGVQSVDVRMMQGGTRVSVAQQTFSGPPSNDQRVPLIVAGGRPRGRGHPRGARARRLLAPDPRRRPRGGEPAGHPRLHPAHSRGPLLHALPLARGLRSGR